jgi:RNA polymerase sigma-70 factor (ECF subfamily)
MSVKELLLDAFSDQNLVTASIGGDRAAYTELVRRHSRMVFAVCLGTLGSIEDAEDMSQEAFVTGFRQLSQLRDGGQFRSWIARVARNLSIDHIRREVRGRELVAANPPELAADPNPNVELHDALGRLPEKYRLPLIMYYLDGRSTEGVARSMEITPAGVRTRLSRARRELRKMLSAKEQAHD